MAQAESALRSKRNGALKSRADDVLQDFVELKKDVSKLAEAATKAVKREVRAASDEISSVRSTLEDRAKGSVAAVGDKVRDRPLAALGIAVGAGLVIGMLLRK